MLVERRGVRWEIWRKGEWVRCFLGMASKGKRDVRDTPRNLAQGANMAGSFTKIWTTGTEGMHTSYWRWEMPVAGIRSYTLVEWVRVEWMKCQRATVGLNTLCIYSLSPYTMNIRTTRFADSVDWWPTTNVISQSRVPLSQSSTSSPSLLSKALAPSASLSRWP